MIVKQLDPQNWRDFVEVRLEALRDCPGVFDSNYEKERGYTEAKWKSWILTDSNRIFGLYEEQRLVGITGIIDNFHDSDCSSALIVSVYIKPAYRGQGYSAKLYGACIEWAVNCPAWQKIIVGHRADNLASRGAILHQGFTFTHRVPRLWPDGAKCDEVWYELDLHKRRKST